MKNEMVNVFTIKMIRALEDNAFASGITIFEMMNLAGKVVAEEIVPFLEKNNNKKITILAGYGNNGGDSLVAAGILQKQGYNCTIILVGDKERFDSDASQANYKELIKLLPMDYWKKIKEVNDIPLILNKIEEDTIIVDALLGIGVKGDLREPIKTVVSFLNEEFKGEIISLDIPSGYNPEFKNQLFVRNPKKIICLGKNKISEGDFKNSEIVVRDIGIPEESEKYVGVGDIKWYFPDREKTSHKRQNGVVTVIGGSIDYIGAPALVAMGAFRTGADLLFILTPSNIRQTVSSFLPDLITIPASENEIQPEDISKLLTNPRIQNCSFVIGPGMMETQTTRKTLQRFLENENSRRIIIDAGALSVMTETHLSMLRNHNVILTPHKGEFARIFGTKLTENINENIEVISSIAKIWGTTILLKGHFDIITDGTRTKINKTGHPGMTVGGTGDVLTGIIGEIFAIEEDSFISATLGAYISGKAGEMAATRYGNGLMASDIPEWINFVIESAKDFRATEI